jgi:outer membrane protein
MNRSKLSGPNGRKGLFRLYIFLLGAATPALMAQNATGPGSMEPPPAAAQKAGSVARQALPYDLAGGCGVVATMRDVERCVGQRPASGLPVLEPRHAYTLPELIGIAETASPEGRVAWASASGALERAGVDHALYLPLITLAVQGSDQRTIVPFPQPIAPRGYVTVEQTIAQAKVQLDYTLVDFGRGARFDSGKALAIASTLRLTRTQQTIAYSTAVQYYLTQQAIGELAAAREILQTAETVLESAQSEYDQGRATIPDLQNAQAGAAAASFDLAAAEGGERKARLALTETLGVEPTTAIEIQPEPQTNIVDEADRIDSSVEELIHAAWSSRPDLLASAQDVRRAHDAWRRAHSAYLPSVSLSAAGGQTSDWASADWGVLGHANIPTWSVEGTMEWELFNGARGHEVRDALAEQFSAAEEDRAKRDSVTRQVWDAYVDCQTAIAQDRSARVFLEAAQTSYSSSLDAFRYGVRSLVDVVEAERQLANARLSVIRAHSQLMRSVVAISYAMGGFPAIATDSSGAHR